MFALDSVPSHIVPPRKQLTTRNVLPSSHTINSSIFTSSDEGSRPKLKEVNKDVKIRKVKGTKEFNKAMKKQNNDPSRDVLQGLLNPYEAMADTKREPHPFAIESGVEKRTKERQETQEACLEQPIPV